MDNHIQEAQDPFAYLENDTPVKEEVTEQVDESVDNAVETVEKTEEATQEPFNWSDLDFKVLKDTKKLGDLTPEEVRERLQKGTDYDRIRPRYDELKGFEEVAKLYGLDSKDLLSELRANHFKNLADKNGTNEDFEKKAYELAIKEQQLTEKEQAEAMQRKDTEAVERFLKSFPDVDPTALPKEVLESAAKGEDIVTSYTNYQNKQLKSELDRLKQAFENIKQAPITATTKNGGEQFASEEDEIMEIMSSGY